MGFTLNRPSAPLGIRNAVLWASARRHTVTDYPGPLSIKSVTSGTVSWKTGGRELVVDRDSFLVLNSGEPYSMNIDAREPVSTLCVFFAAGFAESIAGSMARDDVEPSNPAAAGFAQRLHPADGRILPRMQAIGRAQMADRLWIDEQFLELAADLAMLNRDVRHRVRLMPARRAATREELFRRVRRGQEFLHAAAAEETDLCDLAREACLSPYHFHRAFTRAFGQTPHAYRNGLRMARARRLLETSQLSVTEVCGAVGFESAPSFSNLFRRTFGVPPSEFTKISKIR
jgi:AraC-like DNA-binding protein